MLRVLTSKSPPYSLCSSYYQIPVGERTVRGRAEPVRGSAVLDLLRAHAPPRSRGIFWPASTATGSRFSAGGSGQVARSV